MSETNGGGPPDSTAPARDAGGRWKRGVSGNPGGRRPSLAALIRSKTRGGATLVRFLLALVHDDAQPTRDRLRACEMLLNFGFSKPVPVLEGDGEAPALTLEAARALIAASQDGGNVSYVAVWADGTDAA